MLELILQFHQDEEILKADGFDDAVVGIDYQSNRLIYSVKKMIRVLVKDGMTHEEAMEYLDYNVLGAYVGEKTPIYCYDYYA